MIEIAIGLILGIISGVILGYFIKKKINKQINEEVIEEENRLIKESQDKLNFIENKVREAEIKWKDLTNKTDEAAGNFKKLTETMKEAQNIELEDYYKNELEKIKYKLLIADEQLNRDFELNKEKYNKEINEIKNELNSFKSAREAIIEEQKRQEEMETNRNFYMLQIGEFDKEDIKQLRVIEPMLHNKEVLNKLIWSTYYQTPYKDLVGRIFGTNKISGIYKITCIDNGKSYIGKSVDVANRWAEHIKSSLEIGTIAKNQLYTLMKEKRAENFTFELLEEVNKDKLLERESYWIKFYETDSYGLNMKG